MSQVSYKTILKYYWIQIRKHRGLFYAVFFLYGIGVTGDSVLLPLILRKIIDTVTTTAHPLEAWPGLMQLLMLLAALMVIYNIGFRTGDFTLTRFQSLTMRNLANFAFEKLTNHSYQFFSNSFSGSLVTKVKRFVRSFMDAHDQVAFIFWFTIVQLIGILISLFLIAPLLAWIFLIWACIYLTVAFYLSRWKVKFDLVESAADSKVTGRLADVITNILNLKIFSSRRKEIHGFHGVTENEQKARSKAWAVANYINLFQATLFAIIEFAGIALTLYLWKEGHISTGTIVLFQLFIWAMGHNLWNLSKAMGRISKSFADASELVEIFETPIDIKDPAHSETLQVKNGALLIQNISFRYGEQNDDVFKDFSLNIPAGQRLGLVGHSGSGKSTITKLLLRFADVQKGSITIDGQEITKITQDDLRSCIAYVPQDPILFHRTLRENIAYGNPGATEDEIIDAAKKAHAHEFITSFPKGYDTLVGERGIKLSGGERQRVAIARAMLKRALIIILDEATSSLDAVSETYIQDAFKELMNGKTTIVIAHRLSTIQKLDRIVVLEQGRIVEDGSHAELLEKKGVYYNFWEHQTAGFIE